MEQGLEIARSVLGDGVVDLSLQALFVARQVDFPKHAHRDREIRARERGQGRGIGGGLEALVVDGDTLRDGVVAVLEIDQRGDPAVEPDPAAVLDAAKDEGLPVLKHQ